MSLSPEPVTRRQHRRVGVVELDPHGAAGVVDRHRLVEPAVLDAQLVEQPQRLAGEPAELRMRALGLELGDDHDRQHDLVLGEPGDGAGVGEQHAGVQDVRAAGGGAAAGCRSRCGAARAHWASERGAARASVRLCRRYGAIG